MSYIKVLMEALEGSDIGELDLAEGGTRVVIRRRVATRSAGLSAPVARAAGAEEASSETEPTVAILAPLTGIFYGAPSPDSPPFVQVGEPIQAGQIVCLVEAMKVFNEVKAELSGIATAVAAQPGQLVHRGDVLIRVQPA